MIVVAACKKRINLPPPSGPGPPRAVAHQPELGQRGSPAAPGASAGSVVPRGPAAPLRVSRCGRAIAPASVFATAFGQPAYAVCLRPRAQPALRRRLAYWKRYRGRVCVTCHARPAAHTLRACVRSATLSGLSAYVQSISQRGRQRHPACRHLSCCRVPLATVSPILQFPLDSIHRQPQWDSDRLACNPVIPIRKIPFAEKRRWCRMSQVTVR